MTPSSVTPSTLTETLDLHSEGLHFRTRKDQILTCVLSWVIRYYNKRGGHAVALLVEALRYKPGFRGFDSRWSHLRNSSGRTMALGLTQPLTEMSTRNISWG